jgi:hypothetical protein
MDEHTYAGIVERLTRQRYDPDRLQKTLQRPADTTVR